MGPAANSFLLSWGSGNLPTTRGCQKHPQWGPLVRYRTPVGCARGCIVRPLNHTDRRYHYCRISGANSGSRALRRQLWSTQLPLRVTVHFAPNQPRYTSWISVMGGPDRNLRGFRRVGICCHSGLALFLRPLSRR